MTPTRLAHLGRTTIDGPHRAVHPCWYSFGYPSLLRSGQLGGEIAERGDVAVDVGIGVLD
jgi:hypothetical protein